MSPLIIGIVVVLIAGIIYLSNDIEKKDHRQKHLDSLVKLLGAEMEEISGRPNSFALRFEYRSIPFVYEDIEDTVFEKVMYRAFLRLHLPVNFNVVFTEEVKSSFRSNPAALAGSASSRGSNQIESPKAFKDFGIFSNRPDVAEELFKDDAAVRIFSKFKNRDARSKPDMALEIVDGVLTLKFYPLGQQMDPTIFDLRHNTSLIENYLEDMIVIYRQIKKIVDKL